MDKPQSECSICNRPLGQESKDLGYLVCHDHRLCTVCNIDVSPHEVIYCLTNKVNVTHARCLSFTEVPQVQSQLDLLNLRRLLTETCVRISELSFDQKYQFLRMMQDTAAIVSVHLQKNKQELSTQLNKEKHEREKAQAKGEALTSSRPVGKPADAPDEKVIAWFGQTYGIKERKLILAELKNRDKAIAAMQKYGTSYEAAIAIVEEQFAKKYQAIMPPTGSEKVQ